MKLKGFWYDSLLIILSVSAAAAFAVYTGLKVDMRLALTEAVVILAVVIFGLVRALLANRQYERMLKKASQRMDYSNSKVLSTLPYPSAVCNEKGFVTWCNNLFNTEIADGDISQSFNIGKIIPNTDASGNIYAKVGEKYYSVFTLNFHKDGENYRVFNFLDSTYLKQTEEKYKSTRPYVIVIETDNIDDFRSDFRDSEKTEIKGRMESMIDEWCDKFNSVAKRISDDRLMIITEKNNVDAMRNEKFSILANVRDFEFKNKNAGVTLSVGISGGNTIKDAEKGARKAIEMALGRGGDQVALRGPDGSYEFVGGVSRSAEKYSKTRARMRANKLCSEICDSSNVLVCGHKYSDYDAIGAAVGVALIARFNNIPAYVVTNQNQTLAKPLIDKLVKNGFSELFIDEDEANKLINKKTFLVLVDTHLPSFAECPNLFDKCERYAIIDHHRLSAKVNEDDKHLLHNPTASSACEMVTEYISYTVDDNSVPSAIAEALLSGIMLDTKNFVSRTGVRTFQAAAYLKERGANIVSVKKLFSNSIEITKIKSEVMGKAEQYKNCAISFVSEGTADSRIIAAQAADDLLSTIGIEASFVIYFDGQKTCISARSLGEVNVQLIMEALGGGGHQTMAACQLIDKSMIEAKSLLIKEIDKIPTKEIK